MTTVTLATFTESEVLGWFAARDITKARPYVDLVHDLEITSSQIKAAVPGSAATPYIAQAMLSQGQSGEMMLMSRCTCSAGRHCKHIAAMLLKVVAERAPKEGSPAAPSSMLSWAEIGRAHV